MRLNRDQLSIDTADRALRIAEPRNLERIVAEALVNKGSSMHRQGRLREAVALQELAVRIADESGFTDLRLRGRNNLAVAQIDNDPPNAFKTILEAIDLAKRFGQRGMFNWLAGTGGMFSATLGLDWDRSLELLDETLTSAPPQYDKARALMIRGELLARRGQELDRSVRVAEEAAVGITDGQIVGGNHYLRSHVALVEGRWADAYAESVEAVDEWRDSEPFVLQIALHALARSRRVDDALAIKRRLDNYPGGSSLVKTARVMATALADALQDRSAEALAGFRTAVQTMRGLGVEFEVRGWAPFARDVFERVDAAPYLRMLDEALAAAGEQSSRATVRVRADSSAEVPAS
jgi:tetratricopeptide (TPR) repeat protein